MRFFFLFVIIFRRPVVQYVLKCEKKRIECKKMKRSFRPKRFHDGLTDFGQLSEIEIRMDSSKKFETTLMTLMTCGLVRMFI